LETSQLNNYLSLAPVKYSQRRIKFESCSCFEEASNVQERGQGPPS